VFGKERGVDKAARRSPEGEDGRGFSPVLLQFQAAPVLPSAIKKPPDRGGFHFVVSSALRRLDGADGNLAGAAVFLGVEGNFLAFDEPTHSGAFERGGMDENVLAAVIRLNEAEAFLVVVEFNGARGHGNILS
jgi:hypothetical protein